jgi:putative DNA primase/helicase
MQRKMQNQRCERLRDLEAMTLRRQCARFVADHAQEIANARPVMPPSLNDRESDFWEPLLVLADVVGGGWPERARQVAVGLTNSARENNPISSLLLDIWIQFLNVHADRLFSRTIVAGLNRYEDRPWMQLKNAKEITELWLAKRLQPYGIRSRTLWIGQEHARGYFEKDFRNLFHRYVPQSEVETVLEDNRPGPQEKKVPEAPPAPAAQEPPKLRAEGADDAKA